MPIPARFAAAGAGICTRVVALSSPTMQTRTFSLLLTLAITAGCGKPAAPGAQVPGAAVPGAAPATLAPGEPHFGCFAWSAQAQAAACVTGDHGTAGVDQRLAFVGGQAPALPIGAVIDDATAQAADAALATGGYAPLAGAATQLTAGTAAAVGQDVTVLWASQVTDPGGTNVAPTQRNHVTARCGGKDVELFELEGEGYTATVSTRPVGDRTLIEISIAVALEGEYGEKFEAIVLDPTACTSASSAGT